MKTSAETTVRVIDIASKQGSRDSQVFRHLCRELADADPVDSYFGLLGVFEKHHFAAQELAGLLLMSLKPAPQEPAEAILRRLMPSWDVSVEELPWYMAEAFGIAELLKALATLDAEKSESGGKCKKTETFRYWLKGVARGALTPMHELLLLGAKPTKEQMRGVIERNSLALREKFGGVEAQLALQADSPAGRAHE